MRNSLPALLLAVALLPTSDSVLAASIAGAGTVVQAPEPAAASPVRTWSGREAEFETFIATAPIVRVEDVPLGVTHPRRAFFKPGGLAGSVAWKVIRPGRESGWWESYQSEIAAYELDKILGLGMVPVAVEREWSHQRGAAILWLTPVRSWKEVQFGPKPDKWIRQIVKMKMFDNLIGNGDRNLGNLLVDAEWNVFLIDHSRAFITDKALPAKMAHVDRDLWSRMLSLDQPTLTLAIGKWMDRGALKSILDRRDRMKAVIAALVQSKGEEAVFGK
jgi:Phosphatidylinositol 3- and 4-kinase